MEIIRGLLTFADKNSIFCFSDYLAIVPKAQVQEQIREKSLPDVMLKLYGLGEIDIAGWRAEQHEPKFTRNPDGSVTLVYDLINTGRSTAVVQCTLNVTPDYKANLTCLEKTKTKSNQ